MQILVHVERVVVVIRHVNITHHPIRAVAAFVRHVNVLDRIETESVQAETHPVQRHFEYGVARALVVVVELGHRRAEAGIEVVPVRVFIPLLLGTLVFNAVYVFFALPRVEITVVYHLLGAVRQRNDLFFQSLRFGKPRVGKRRVIEHEIHDNLHALTMRFIHQLLIVVQRTEPRVYRKVVHNVVAVIRIGVLERRKPQRVNT